MKRNEKNQYQKLYRQNKETNGYMIEVSLDDYSELFNGWDASPLRKKDLEPELVDYLEQAGNEIPFKEKIETVFYIPKDKKDTDKEDKSLLGISNHLHSILFFITKKLSLLYRQTVIFILLSFTLLLFAYLLQEQGETLLFSIMIQGFFIGGWFLLWEAFSTFFFTSHELRIRKRIFKRFLVSPVYFLETNQ